MLKICGSATTADLHLRNYVWAARPRLKGDALIAAKYIFDHCLENRFSLKLAGDIFHTLAILPEFIAPIFGHLDRMQEAGLPVYYVQGNHDKNAVPWLSLHKWPINLNNRIVELEECRETIMGIEATGEEDLRELLKRVPANVNTLLMHQAEKQAMPFNPNFDLSWVPDSIKLVLIGDIHSSQTYSNKHTELWYPGSPSITDISQTEPRSFLVEGVDALGGTQVVPIRIPGRQVYRLDVDKDEDLEWAMSEVSSIAENDLRHFELEPIIRIVYKPQLADKVSQIFLPFRETLGVYTWLDVKSADEVVRSVISAGMQTGQTALVMEKVIADHVNDPEVRELLIRIFRDSDVAGVLTPELEKVL